MSAFGAIGKIVDFQSGSPLMRRVSRYCLGVLVLVAMSLWALSTTPLYGMTYVTPERSAALSIASWLEHYARDHENKLPTSWQDLQPLFNAPLDDLMPHAAPTKRYALVSPPLSIAKPVRGEVVAINRSDIFDTTVSQGLFGTSRGFQGPGRYVIYRTKNGEFITTWISAGEVLDLYARANAALPEPDGEPERVWVSSARRAHLIWNIVRWSVIGGLAWGLWRYLRKESTWGMMVGFWWEDLGKWWRSL